MEENNIKRVNSLTEYVILLMNVIYSIDNQYIFYRSIDLERDENDDDDGLFF